MLTQLSLFAPCGDDFNAICASIGCDNTAPAWVDDFGKRIRDYLVVHNERPIRTLSLFSGAGGLDIGFHDAGFEIVESVEIEKKFCKTLELNSGPGKRFEGSKVNCIDIRQFSGEHLGQIEFIVGGPPCQTFSAAGRRANGVLGTTDARGVLFREYVRLLTELRPRGFLFENVYGITGADGGAPWREIIKSFKECGYTLHYRVVDAADYGVPQHRERLLIVGLKEGVFKFPRPSHGPDSIGNIPFYNAQTAVRGLKLTKEERRPGIGGRLGHLLKGIPPGLNYSFYTEEMGYPEPVFAWRSKFSDFLYKADPEQPVRTIKASGGAYTGPFSWENRTFSYSEFKRLQTFPDDYQISGGKQVAVKQIGNSVPPQLSRMMAIAIRAQVFGTKFPFALPLLDEGEVLSFRQRKHELTQSYREKARAAIQSLPRAKKSNAERIPRETNKYYARMDDSFKFEVAEKRHSQYSVSVKWEGELLIDVRRLGRKKRSRTMTINVIISDKKISVGVSRVLMRVYSDDPITFTVAWKAFERELITKGIRADLVQLNGYYQYEPMIKCTCSIVSSIQFSDVLQKVTSGIGVAKILDSETICRELGIETQQLLSVASFLRSLGFEIRNHNTNPQIDENYWLIPYAFPTLTPVSVQLHKKV